MNKRMLKQPSMYSNRPVLVANCVRFSCNMFSGLSKALHNSHRKRIWRSNHGLQLSKTDWNLHCMVTWNDIKPDSKKRLQIKERKLIKSLQILLIKRNTTKRNRVKYVMCIKRNNGKHYIHYYTFNTC